MCLIFFTLPLKIVKESFIELGGGIMQDSATKEMAEKTIIELLPSNLIKQSIYISKLGSSYFILVYVSSDTNKIDLSRIETLRKKIQQTLIHIFTNLKFEIIVRCNYFLLNSKQGILWKKNHWKTLKFMSGEIDCVF